MSCVVGIVKDNKVWLGSESCATTSDGERRFNKLEKIFRNGPYLIGFVGTVRPGQVLLPNYFKPPKNVMDFPDAIIKQFGDKGCLGIDGEDQTYCQATNFLVAYENRLYEILVDFQMNEIDNYSAIGSGSDFATGSLHTTSFTDLTPDKRIILALKAAVNHDMGCAGPYIIKTQPE